MKKIAVVFADGTEEIEALTPVDVLRRAGAVCDIVSVSGKTPVGSHGITVKADKLASFLDMSDYDGIVIPGGIPGAVNISRDRYVIRAIENAIKDGKLVAAICASPAVVLAEHGFIGGKATCYPAENFIAMLGENYTGADVEINKNVITANGPKSAMKFSEEICVYFGLKPKF